MQINDAIIINAPVNQEIIDTMQNAIINNIDNIMNNIDIMLNNDINENARRRYSIVINEDGIIRMSKHDTDDNKKCISAAFVTIAKKARLSISISPNINKILSDKNAKSETMSTILYTLLHQCCDIINETGSGGYLLDI